MMKFNSVTQQVIRLTKSNRKDLRNLYAVLENQTNINK